MEEEDAEWRDLDYDVEVGAPPCSFTQFYLQYIWGVFDNKMMDKNVSFSSFKEDRIVTKITPS